MGYYITINRPSRKMCNNIISDKKLNVEREKAQKCI